MFQYLSSLHILPLYPNVQQTPTVANHQYTLHSFAVSISVIELKSFFKFSKTTVQYTVLKLIKRKIIILILFDDSKITRQLSYLLIKNLNPLIYLFFYDNKEIKLNYEKTELDKNDHRWKCHKLKS